MGYYKKLITEQDFLELEDICEWDDGDNCLDDDFEGDEV